MNEGELIEFDPAMPIPPVKLVPTKSDAEIADGIKNEIIEGIKPLLKVFDRAKDAGFHVNFQIGIDWTGKNVIQALELLKRF